MIDYDAELRLHDRLLRRAHGIGRRDCVLDVGCGAGQTTRDAARIASEGRALGVDSSEQMIERARSLTRAEGLRNVTYECGDAQRHPFAPGRFDVAISRFGTMFFADPVAAFANIRRALRPAGRLVMMVWQNRDRNEWAVSIQRTLLGDEAASAGALAGSQAFSLGDPRAVEQILGTAGFGGIAFDEVREPVYYGPDVDAALDFVSQFASVQGIVASLPVGDRECALHRLRELLAGHRAHDGVWFESRAWIVTARPG